MRHELVTKLEHPHTEDCWALEAVARGDWFSPWWIPGKHVSRAVDGTRRRSGHRFQKWECNSTNCEAVLLVSELGLTDLVAALGDNHGVD